MGTTGVLTLTPEADDGVSVADHALPKSWASRRRLQQVCSAAAAHVAAGCGGTRCCVAATALRPRYRAPVAGLSCSDPLTVGPAPPGFVAELVENHDGWPRVKNTRPIHGHNMTKSPGDTKHTGLTARCAHTRTHRHVGNRASARGRRLHLLLEFQVGGLRAPAHPLHLLEQGHAELFFLNHAYVYTHEQAPARSTLSFLIKERKVRKSALTH